LQASKYDPAKIHHLFSQFDVDGSGQISMDYFKQVRAIPFVHSHVLARQTKCPWQRRFQMSNLQKKKIEFDDRTQLTLKIKNIAKLQNK
jgi:hypothetical protein